MPLLERVVYFDRGISAIFVMFNCHYLTSESISYLINIAAFTNTVLSNII